MKTLLDMRVHITPDMEKTNIPLPFCVPQSAEKLCITYSYAPKELSGAAGEAIAEACLLRDTGEFREEYPAAEAFLPLKNLITLSLDDPYGYRGAAHRQAPQQVHILTESEASPGFYAGAVSAGDWKLTLNVHALVTEFCDCEIKVEVEEGTKDA